MKKNKKAQISNTLSWFIATIVIIFILMIFVFFAGLKSIRDESNNIVDDVKIVGTAAFLSQKEQRGLFSLLEDKVDNKKFYDATKEFIMKRVKKDQRPVFGNQLIDENDVEYRYLISKIKKTKINCSRFFVIKPPVRITVNYGNVNEGLAPTGIAYESTDYEIYYYFRYPFVRLDNPFTYSFFFPEKSFALIKYYIEEC